MPDKERDICKAITEEFDFNHKSPNATLIHVATLGYSLHHMRLIGYLDVIEICTYIRSFK